VHIGPARVIAAAALLVCFAHGTLAANVGRYRPAPAHGWTDATHRSISRIRVQRVLSGQRLARPAWHSSYGRRGLAPSRDPYARPKPSYETNGPSPPSAERSIQPVGATVVTRQTIDDLNATRLRDVLPYVAGVTVR
jgi:hypothetical protein